MKAKTGSKDTKRLEKRLTVKPTQIKEKTTANRRGSISATLKSNPPASEKNQTGNDSDSSSETEYIINETQIIRENLLGSLSKFKDASKELYEASRDFFSGFNDLNKDFINVQKEIREIVDETDLSKQEICKLQVRQEGIKDLDLKRKNRKTDLAEIYKEETKQKVLMLKKKVDELKGELVLNEEETMKNDCEYDGLKNYVCKIQGAFGDASDSEDSRKAACQSCVLF